MWPFDVLKRSSELSPANKNRPDNVLYGVHDGHSVYCGVLYILEGAEKFSLSFLENRRELSVNLIFELFYSIVKPSKVQNTTLSWRRTK
jgi:hypothetical protein